MANTMGLRLSDDRTGAGVLVTRAGAGTLGFSVAADGVAPLVLGRRFSCATCSTTILCTKAGDAAAECCGAVMEPVEAKPLPSSD